MSEPAIRLVVPPDLHSRAAKNGAPSGDTLALRLEASRVLALALVDILESESDNDRSKTQWINLREVVQRFEQSLIRSALKQTGGRQRRAARLLGLNVSSLNMRIKRYKLGPQDDCEHITDQTQ